VRPLTPSPAYTASRPLFVEHPDEPVYRFTKRGSAFLSRFRDHSYAVLARHSVTEYSAERIRIPVHDGFNEFFGFDYHWTPTGTDDCNDLLLLRLTTTTDHGNWRASRAPILRGTVAIARTLFVPGGDLVISGYPGIGQNNVDYDTDTITNQRFIVQCEYAEPTDNHVHLLRVRQSGTIPEFGGYSGAIVIGRHDNGLVTAGVVITGSAQANLIRFIDADGLYLSLENFAEQIDAA
jgi:hypothetical protein